MIPLTDKPLTDQEREELRAFSKLLEKVELFVVYPNGKHKRVSWSPLHRRLYRYWSKIQVAGLELRYAWHSLLARIQGD